MLQGNLELCFTGKWTLLGTDTKQLLFNHPPYFGRFFFSHLITSLFNNQTWTNKKHWNNQFKSFSPASPGFETPLPFQFHWPWRGCEGNLGVWRFSSSSTGKQSWASITEVAIWKLFPYWPKQLHVLEFLIWHLAILLSLFTALLRDVKSLANTS